MLLDWAKHRTDAIKSITVLCLCKVKKRKNMVLILKSISDHKAYIKYILLLESQWGNVISVQISLSCAILALVKYVSISDNYSIWIISNNVLLSVIRRVMYIKNKEFYLLGITPCSLVKLWYIPENGTFCNHCCEKLKTDTKNKVNQLRIMYKKSYHDQVLKCLMKHEAHNRGQTTERNITEFRGDLGCEEKKFCVNWKQLHIQP